MKIVPICDAQRKDVNPEDLLQGGLYRVCDTYKGGGGYDQFTRIAERRLGREFSPLQFVAQVQGCPLKCPYCYVTDEGVNGEAIEVKPEELIHDWKGARRAMKAMGRPSLDVFHLMGGAPANYIESWRQLAWAVEKAGGVFHSDFLLVEPRIYNKNTLAQLPGLHAVSIKQPEIYTEEQRVKLFDNLEMLVTCGVNFYLTFTGAPTLRHAIEYEFGQRVLRDSFTIDINYKYEALA